MSQPNDLPNVIATIRADGYTEVVLDGVPYATRWAALDEARQNVVALVRERVAQPLGRSVRVDVDDPQGPTRVVVSPDGSVVESPLTEVSEDTIPPGHLPPVQAPQPAPEAAAWGPPQHPQQAGAPPEHEASPEPVPTAQVQPPSVEQQPNAPSVASWMRTAAGSEPRPAQPGIPPPPAPHGQQPPWPAQTMPTPGSPQPNGWSPDPEAPLTRRQMRESFLHAEQTELPATTGVRGVLSRVGIRVQPSAAEREERDDIHTVSQHWPGVRTIAVVNGKGGAGKTPTTALLAATFARFSGAATIAWDNNETRGTLGWRTEQGKHENTVLDLIPRAGELLDPGARAGDISHYVHHQAADKYDVLRSNPHLLSAEQRIHADDVDAIHDVLGRYYRLIFVDSGNDESASHWLRMIDKADQLVVPTIARPEHAEAGALLLEELARRGGRSAELAQRAVVIVSQAREKDANPSATDIARGFAGWTSAVVTIPYDRAMVESVLRFDALAAPTRRAWLRAAAAVARQL